MLPPLHPRVRAVADLSMAEVREGAGRHEYDGQVQDLSSDGVARGLAALGGSDSDGSSAPLPDPIEEQHLAVHERLARTTFTTLRAHRTNPLVHLSALDLSDYERDYAPLADREQARAAHLAAWPDAVDVAIATLDEVSAPVAVSLRSAVAGLGAALRPEDGELGRRAEASVARLVAHIDAAAQSGPPDAAIGRAALEELMTVGELIPFDTTVVAERAERERERLHDLLRDGLARLGRTGTSAVEVAALLADHPTGEEVLEEARELSRRVVEWTAELELAPVDGELVVEVSPPARRWAVAMMSWAAPGEPPGPSLYSITPPEPTWPAQEQEQWLCMFSRTTLPVITLHEVAPGHYSHGCALRRCEGDVRRTLQGLAFCEGWAHYTEELAVELGFSDDPRLQVGMALEALCRVVRLECAIGVHTGAFDVAEATRRFHEHAYIETAGARAEAQRATFDPAYGCYTWGKWAVLDAREHARARWGNRFSLPAFHRTLLSLGSPPLGLLRAAVDAAPVP